MMKNIIIFMLVMLLPGNAFATAQIPDNIMYKGEAYSLFGEPLERYFSEKTPRPKEIVSFCSSCWRGYVASWEIKENYLYLVKVVEGTCGSDAKEIALSKIFFGQEAPVKAVWFSGVLRILRGNQLYSEQMGSGSVYEKDLMLTIENGVMVSETIIDNTKRERLPVLIKPY